MTRAKIAILATTLWATGFMFVGAMAHAYSAPQRIAPQTVTVVAPVAKRSVAAPPLAKVADHVKRIEKVVVPPPPPPVVKHVAKVAAPAPKHEVKCTGWRDIGSSSVRVCE